MKSTIICDQTPRTLCNGFLSTCFTKRAFWTLAVTLALIYLGILCEAFTISKYVKIVDCITNTRFYWWQCFLPTGQLNENILGRQAVFLHMVIQGFRLFHGIIPLPTRTLESSAYHALSTPPLSLLIQTAMEVWQLFCSHTCHLQHIPRTERTIF